MLELISQLSKMRSEPDSSTVSCEVVRLNLNSNLLLIAGLLSETFLHYVDPTYSNIDPSQLTQAHLKTLIDQLGVPDLDEAIEENFTPEVKSLKSLVHFSKNSKCKKILDRTAARNASSASADCGFFCKDWIEYSEAVFASAKTSKQVKKLQEEQLSLERKVSALSRSLRAAERRADLAEARAKLAESHVKDLSSMKNAGLNTKGIDSSKDVALFMEVLGMPSSQVMEALGAADEMQMAAVPVAKSTLEATIETARGINQMHSQQAIMQQGGANFHLHAAANHNNMLHVPVSHLGGGVPMTARSVHSTPGFPSMQVTPPNYGGFAGSMHGSSSHAVNMHHMQLLAAQQQQQQQQQQQEVEHMQLTAEYQEILANISEIELLLTLPSTGQQFDLNALSGALSELHAKRDHYIAVLGLAPIGASSLAASSQFAVNMQHAPVSFAPPGATATLLPPELSTVVANPQAPVLDSSLQTNTLATPPVASPLQQSQRSPEPPPAIKQEGSQMFHTAIEGGLNDLRENSDVSSNSSYPHAATPPLSSVGASGRQQPPPLPLGGNSQGTSRKGIPSLNLAGLSGKPHFDN